MSEHEQDGDDAPFWRDPSRDDGWRAPARPGRSRGPKPVPVGLGAFWHAWECSVLAMLVTAVAAWLLPRWATVQEAVAGGALLTLAAWFTAFRATGSRAVAVYTAAWGAFITGWVAWTYRAGLWHSPVIMALVLGGSVLGLLGVAVAGHHAEQLAAAQQASAARGNDLELRRWVNLFADNGVPGVLIRDVDERDGVIEVTGRLPGATRGRRAVTYAQLTAIGPELATHLRRDADGVYFSQPDRGSAADFVMHVRELRRGRARPTVHLPMENRPLTVNRPLGLGVLDNRRVFRESLVGKHLLIGGSTGWGKSSMLNVLIALLAACPDALIWMIDMSGGVLVRPWIMPWLARHADRPVIDWFATTREEAKIMLEASLKLCDIRAAYPVFEKVTPSEETPALVLGCDDMGKCFGHGTVTGKGEERISNWGLSQLGSSYTEHARKAAGSLVGAVQRTNVELMGGTGIKAMSDLRFGLHCNDAADGQRIFPDDAQAARLLATLKDKGDCLVKRPEGITPVVHLYRIDDEQRITDRAIWAGNLRPQLEPGAAEKLGEAYAGRWDRNADLLADWRASAGIPEPAEREPEMSADYRKIAHLDFDPEGDLHPSEERMLAIVREAGWAGIKVSRITAKLDAEGKTVHRGTVHTWLDKHAKLGRVHRPRHGSSNWTWADQDRLPGAM